MSCDKRGYITLSLSAPRGSEVQHPRALFLLAERSVHGKTDSLRTRRPANLEAILIFGYQQHTWKIN
ncbi:hypothetical protein MAR_022746 [Mya arenaria]|uniref:Uncharacterized protein n=1 Tax=Mya arenaria TaxID=6604 RepID=A0ABY7DMI4_MYAAR|nr:hypothetical protein MAR_022746 [Mya arenaria]